MAERAPPMLVARRRPQGAGLPASASMLLAIGFGAAWWQSRPCGEAQPTPVGCRQPRLSLVVLPFENLGDDPKDDYLADGITDDLTTDLSRIPDAFVIARESAYPTRARPDLRQIGRELGVRYVIEGSVRRINSTLRVNVQLISSETGGLVWSDRFDEEISELAAGQEQVVTRMRAGLGISMVE